jgi:predicted phage terminase large subunit-like protein
MLVDTQVASEDEAPAAAPPVDPVDFLTQTARTNFAAFVTAVHRPRFRHSAFSARVCRQVDKFVEDVIAGKRPVLMLTAPPQHGKSSLISRCLPPYLFGRLSGQLDAVRIACSSYALPLARRNTKDANSIMGEPVYRAIFPHVSLIGYNGVDNADGFDVPGGGGLKGVGVKGSLTGFSVEVGIVDDPTKDAESALSPVQQDAIEAWYESVLLTRLQSRSGTVIIGTPWSANDLLARVRRKMRDDSRFTLLSFPALNLPGETGYNPELPEGALVPHLHDETKLREMKKNMSSFWWSAMFQQVPMAEFGAIFKREHLQLYRRPELPQTFVQMCISVDATFKDGNASDFVAVGVWGKTADDRVWLVDFRREQLAFMNTARAIIDLKKKHPRVMRIYIEEAANGAALLDMLKKHIVGLVGVPPLGSKEARAHAVAWVWEANNVLLPHPDESPGIQPWIDEITSFPDTISGHDDTVDCMSIALQQLCLRSPIAALITKEILHRAS